MDEKLKNENKQKRAVFYVYVILAEYPGEPQPAGAGVRAERWVPRQLSENDILPHLTAHSWLADSAHCCLSLGI